MLVIIDFAILQAEIHYNLAHKIHENRNRVDWYEKMAVEMINTDWAKLVSMCKEKNEELYHASTSNHEMDENNNESVLQNMGSFLSPIYPGKNQSDNCAPVLAKDIYNSVDGRSCQICRFEGRGRKLGNVLYCTKHKVRCCSSTHEDHTWMEIFKQTPNYNQLRCTDWTWLCPNKQWTCWDKYHNYYGPAGLFRPPHDQSKPKCSVLLNQTHELAVRRRNATKPNQNYMIHMLPNHEGPLEIVTNDSPIIKGKKTLIDDLENDVTKDNYASLTRHENDRNQLRKKRKLNADSEKIDNILPQSLCRQFSI